MGIPAASEMELEAEYLSTESSFSPLRAAAKLKGEALLRRGSGMRLADVLLGGRGELPLPGLALLRTIFWPPPPSAPPPPTIPQSASFSSVSRRLSSLRLRYLSPPPPPPPFLPEDLSSMPLLSLWLSPPPAAALAFFTMCCFLAEVDAEELLLDLLDELEPVFLLTSAWNADDRSSRLIRLATRLFLSTSGAGAAGAAAGLAALAAASLLALALLWCR